jgi:hypothetical protein
LYQYNQIILLKRDVGLRYVNESSEGDSGCYCKHSIKPSMFVKRSYLRVNLSMWDTNAKLQYRFVKWNEGSYHYWSMWWYMCNVCVLHNLRWLVMSMIRIDAHIKNLVLYSFFTIEDHQTNTFIVSMWSRDLSNNQLNGSIDFILGLQSSLETM